MPVIASAPLHLLSREPNDAFPCTSRHVQRGRGPSLASAWTRSVENYRNNTCKPCPRRAAMCVGADNLRPLPGTPPTRSAQSACVLCANMKRSLAFVCPRARHAEFQPRYNLESLSLSLSLSLARSLSRTLAPSLSCSLYWQDAAAGASASSWRSRAMALSACPSRPFTSTTALFFVPCWLT